LTGALIIQKSEQFSRRVCKSTIASVIALGFIAAPLRGQSRAVSVDVTVTVTDSSGARIAGADLALRRLGTRNVLQATTDQRGEHRFNVPGDTGAISLVARKVGYSPVAQEFRVDTSRANDVTVVLAKAPAMLDTTRVRANVPRSKIYYIGAADIAKSTRYMEDAFDAISKLEPQMLGDGYRMCPTVKYIGINGKRAYTAPIGGLPRAPATRVSAAGVPERQPGSGELSREYGNTNDPPNAATVLATIHADHLAEIRYVNCWDRAMPGVGGSDALYIVLKPGVQWDWKRGSRVVDSAMFRQKP
jgi:hypothetical protein